jgi:hypothetical protein
MRKQKYSHIDTVKQLSSFKEQVIYDRKRDIAFSVSTRVYLWLYSPSLGLHASSVTSGLFGLGISQLQGRHLHTDIHAFSGIRTHNPSVRAGENALDGAATVIGIRTEV